MLRCFNAALSLAGPRSSNSFGAEEEEEDSFEKALKVFHKVVPRQGALARLAQGLRKAC